MAQRLSGPQLLRVLETQPARRLGPLRAGPTSLPPAATAAPAPAPAAMTAPRTADTAEDLLPASVVATRLREAAETAWRRGRLEGQEEGREQGLREGLAQGRSEAAARLERSEQQLVASMQAAAQALADRLASAEQLATALAGQTLVQLLGEGAARGPLLMQLLQHRLAAIAEGNEVTVRLHADDLQALGGPASLGARLQQPHGPRVQLRADAALAPGACTFDLALGRLDAGLDTAIELIRRHFEPAAGAADAGA